MDSVHSTHHLQTNFFRRDNIVPVNWLQVASSAFHFRSWDYTERDSLKSTFAHFGRNQISPCRILPQDISVDWGAALIAEQYFVRQATALVEQAPDLKSRIDERTPPPDRRP